MKNLMKALPLLVILFSGSAYAEISKEQEEAERKGEFYWATKPVTCTSGDKIIELMKQHGETPTIWMQGLVGHPNGTMTESRFVVAMNTDANPVTWTLLEFTDNGTQGCVLGHGTGNINLGIAQKQEGTKT